MQNVLNTIEKKLDFINGTYDYMRIVNPVEKKVFAINKDGRMENIKVKCFDYWNRNKICKNCISMRAFCDNKIIVKIENNKEKSVIVIAVPININGQTMIAEILKYIESADKNAEEFDCIIQALNKKIGTDELTKLYNKNYIESRLSVDVFNSNNTGKNINIAVISCEKEDVLKVAEIIKEKYKQDKELYAARYEENNFIVVSLNNDKSYVTDNLLDFLKEFKSDCSIISSEDKKLDYMEIINNIEDEIRKINRSLHVKLLSNNIEQENDIKVVNEKMEELREILNAMCLENTDDYEDIVYVSQCLDKAIVSYMNLLNKKNIV